MGITIHYRGSLPQEHTIDEVLAHFKQLCFERDIECWTKDSEVTAENCLDPQEIGTHIRGIEINVHPNCETLAITFDTKTKQLCDIWTQVGTGKKFVCGKAWQYIDEKGIKHRSRGSLFCKTQFAGAYAHIIVCRLLQELKDRFIPRLTVSDEGEYWETRDVEKLKHNISYLGEMIKGFSEMLKEVAKGEIVETGYDVASKRKLSHN